MRKVSKGNLAIDASESIEHESCFERVDFFLITEGEILRVLLQGR